MLDIFAAQALTGLIIANADRPAERDRERMARTAYLYADEMMAEKDRRAKEREDAFDAAVNGRRTK